MPLAERAPARETSAPTVTHPDATAFEAGDFSTQAFTPQKGRVALQPELGTADLPDSDAMISADDHRRGTKTKRERIPFTHTENGLNELAFDDPGAKAWFADDENLLARMRGVRDQVSEMLDWGLDDKINEAGRELLETLGIDDTSTTRLMVAQRTTEDAPPPRAAQAANQDKGPGAPPWDAESGRNAFAKFGFLVWDTLTHPALLALVFLALGVRSIMTLARLSRRSRARKRRRSRTKSASIEQKAASHGKHWGRRRRIR